MQNRTGFHDTYVAMHTNGFNKLTADKCTELQQEAYKRWINLLFLKHADMRRYGSLIDNLKAFFAHNQD